MLATWFRVIYQRRRPTRARRPENRGPKIRRAREGRPLAKLKSAIISNRGLARLSGPLLWWALCLFGMADAGAVCNGGRVPPRLGRAAILRGPPWRVLRRAREGRVVRVRV